MHKLKYIFIAVFLFFSCKKNDDQGINLNNNWKIGPNQFNATVVKDSIPGSWYALSENSMFVINFKDTLIPGNYKIVYLATDSFQMNIAVSTLINGVKTYYNTTNNSTAFATVTLDTSQKTIVHIPEIWAYNSFNNKDSVKISGTISK